MRIDVYADFTCPWCYIGLRHMRAALARRPAIEAELRWRPFQLNPNMPRGGLDRKTYLALRFGHRDRSRHLHDLVTETGRAVGLEFRFERIERQPNTLDAHRLVRFAGDRGQPVGGLIEAMYRAYFTDGSDIGDRQNLIALAGAAGLKETEVAGYLASDADFDAVRADDTRARRMGIDGVPCFVFGGRYAVTGAQEPEAFLPLIDVARAA